ncbi:hypothetical protein BIW11_00069 [Tropilaelaps mercedesae]|uniref:Uncharacterized protein n=1 Tax=Tropilaelaps mercedesae TaxID=418985 RepID=A0A1V9Y2R2_9ACAR|nr:hypothetical protein BIW11_00069 [Tropilaelaps mercedesae]
MSLELRTATVQTCKYSMGLSIIGLILVTSRLMEASREIEFLRVVEVDWLGQFDELTTGGGVLRHDLRIFIESVEDVKVRQKPAGDSGTANFWIAFSDQIMVDGRRSFSNVQQQVNDAGRRMINQFACIEHFLLLFHLFDSGALPNATADIAVGHD